ncbi:MAG: hypothetical protein H2056_03900 [Sphingopyxis sp.]|nr:hypothetical protein [Sphingopyxis sp.]
MSPILTTDLTLATSLVLFAGLVVVTMAALKGWRDWIALKREELAHVHAPAHAGGDQGVPSAASRIELADLKERLRKLEAIAAGVDL